MTFLDLCKRLRREGGLSGTGPDAVTSTNSQDERVIGWVQEAWVDIQRMRPNWLFMNVIATFDTATGVRDYLASDKSITDLSLWDKESFYVRDTALTEDDQNALPYIDYREWRYSYRQGMATRTNDRPQMFTILPDNKLRMEPAPDKAYTLDFDYKRVAQNFAANGDTPTNLPDDFHMIIVWQALKYLADHENSPEHMDKAEMNFDNLLTRLEKEQLPDMSLAYQTLA